MVVLKSLVKVSSVVEVCFLGGCPRTACQRSERKNLLTSYIKSVLLHDGLVGINLRPLERTERSAVERGRSSGMVKTWECMPLWDDVEGRLGELIPLERVWGDGVLASVMEVVGSLEEGVEECLGKLAPPKRAWGNGVLVVVGVTSETEELA